MLATMDFNRRRKRKVMKSSVEAESMPSVLYTMQRCISLPLYTMQRCISLPLYTMQRCLALYTTQRCLGLAPFLVLISFCAQLLLIISFCFLVGFCFLFLRSISFINARDSKEMWLIGAQKWKIEDIFTVFGSLLLWITNYQEIDVFIQLGVKLEEVLLGAKNGDSSLISTAMTKEEEKLLDARVKEEVGVNGADKAPNLNDNQFTKLDELLTQTQLFSEFLLEKLDGITANALEEETEPVEEKKKGRGSKRKAAANYNNANRPVAAMLTRSQAGVRSQEGTPAAEDYQLKGVKWLISLWQNGLNGILADQMRLGKTIQTIGFLAHLKGKGLDGPYVVITPLSTLSNWVNEISRFVPSIKSVIYLGDKKTRDEIRRKHMPKIIGPDFLIIITSFEVAMNDAKKHLRHYNWKYLLVDEGHRLKNSQCKLLKELKYLPVENKLLLTGTPLQNNLAELWSLLNFILPDIFSSHAAFESWFDLSGKCNNEVGKEEMEEKRRAQVVAKLHALLTEHQKNFQDHLVNKPLEGYLQEKVDIGCGVKGKLNNLMIQLRKNCNYPDLLEASFDGSYFYLPLEQLDEHRGKFRLLDKLLSRLFARNHKIQEFNDLNSNFRIFLLSTKAGGLGINLTAADTCILYDSDWNPQLDLQATDRCHRIGQRKPVHVYRLAAAQSLEGSILKRAFSKLKLEHMVIRKGQFKQERTKTDDMEEEDLMALVREEEDEQDKMMIQKDISAEDLERVLDGRDLVAGNTNTDGKPDFAVSLLPLEGPGREVVIPNARGACFPPSTASFWKT